MNRGAEGRGMEKCGRPLKREGPIGSMDLMIAAHAVSLGLITNNTREFSRVPSLTILDWTV